MSRTPRGVRHGAWYRDMRLYMNADRHVLPCRTFMWQESFPNCPVFIMELVVINSYISLSNSIKLRKRSAYLMGRNQRK